MSCVVKSSVGVGWIGFILIAIRDSPYPYAPPYYILICEDVVVVWGRPHYLMLTCPQLVRVVRASSGSGWWLPLHLMLTPVLPELPSPVLTTLNTKEKGIFKIKFSNSSFYPSFCFIFSHKSDSRITNVHSFIHPSVWNSSPFALTFVLDQCNLVCFYEF